MNKLFCFIGLNFCTSIPLIYFVFLVQFGTKHVLNKNHGY